MLRDGYKNRSIVIFGAILFVAVAFIVRLINIQIFDDSWKMMADNQVVRRIVKRPARGLIYDRNDNIIVFNEAAFDLYATPNKVGEFDTIQLLNLVGVDKDQLDLQMQKARNYATYKASPIVKEISYERAALLQEKIYKFPGFSIQRRTIRQYPYQNASHVLGYVGEVSQYKIEQDPYYQRSDSYGVSGLEKAFEKELRGEKGVEYFMNDVRNNLKGKLDNGKFDTAAVIGSNLITTLDIDLQTYAESLMVGKAGGIIAIEPSTGEVLAMVSTPSFKPSSLVGQERSKNYSRLSKDPLKPLYNRAISASYPPGSTFKIVNSLVGLELGSLTLATRYPCSGRSSLPIRCSHNHGSPVDIFDGITQSCNPFFWQTFKAILNSEKSSKLGYAKWREIIASFGFGGRVGKDLYGENKGFVPTVGYYDKIYRGSWNALTVRSLSIGQGEILCTALQMANFGAAVANRGYYYDPHLVKSVGVDGDMDMVNVEKHIVKVDPKHFEPVIQGMFNVIQTGTGRSAKVDSIEICGKTGTIQNPHGEAHSAFLAFAPKDKPKIAVYVYVEAGVSGARYAAPISTLMIEYYLKGEIKGRSLYNQERMFNADLLNKVEE